MLEMRPNCECCDADLSADSREAWICSFECTFCDRCNEQVLKGGCPNCGGELVRRPTRSPELWADHPPSANRVRRKAACAPAD